MAIDCDKAEADLRAFNEGKVVGIVTWGSSNLAKEDFNGARSLDTFCLKIIKCEYEYKGEKTWYDWND